MSLIPYAMRMAKRYYDDKTYNHACRVAQYVAENNLISSEIIDDCIALAYMHDLIEDTDYIDGASDLPTHLYDCLQMLTKLKEEDYITYTKRIRKFASSNTEAYWVKLADMKDHLAQTETLTDKLRDKYLAALPYLL